MQGERLVFPAVAEESPGTWVFRGEFGTMRWQCHGDPRSTARGRATFPTTAPAETAAQHFVATLDPTTRELARLEFFEDFADGPRRACALVRDAKWGLWFEGSGWFGVDERCWEPLDPQRDRGFVDLLGRSDAPPASR
jgi:hypothetical protein